MHGEKSLQLLLFANLFIICNFQFFRKAMINSCLMLICPNFLNACPKYPKDLCEGKKDISNCRRVEFCMCGTIFLNQLFWKTVSSLLDLLQGLNYNKT